MKISVQGSKVVVVGAGMAGLAAALELSARGMDVTVLERAATPGGKLREIAVGDVRVDAGPTVFTMRWVFDALFAAVGTSTEAHLTLQPAEVLARHAWDGTTHLDLFADLRRSVDAIGDFAGAAEARGYRAFAARAQKIFQTLDQTFMQAPQPGSSLALARRIGLLNPGTLLGLSPFDTLWSGLAAHFKDQRLLQLFGRYATYCGSSPYLAPATLMLVAHAEARGVWMVQGGMHRVAVALAGLAAARGAVFRYGAEVAEILTTSGRVSGVRLAGGEQLAADAVVLNSDVAAASAGLFGRAAAQAVPAQAGVRSLSALTWTMQATASGFPLLRHNVFFSGNYAAEFDDIFKRARLPGEPTVYVCAQDRGDVASETGAAERLLVLVNAPARGDTHEFDAAEIAQCETRTFDLLARCGLQVEQQATVITTPTGWNRLFPATGGALYGMASHGSMAPFRRPASRSRLPGLYLAGGSAHPGPGVPMAALSGRLAASCVLEDLTSRSRSRRMATPGGMSMR